MEPLRCPTCSARVERESDACPSCGSEFGSLDPETATDLSPLAPTRLDLQPGFLFDDRYTIIERVGEGAMGVVYKAIDRTLDSLVALKLIQPSLSLALPPPSPICERKRWPDRSS